ncbi:MAG TPA: DUF3775 domain-containing protein [Pseudomonadales bacterium]
MLDVNPDTVCRLIDLAREFHAQEAVVIPEEPGSPADDWTGNVLAAHADDATLEEFRSIIADLEPDQQQQVVALLWIGRGDFGLDEWDEALAQAADAWNERTADYLISHPMLADYLAEGLELHGYECD